MKITQKEFAAKYRSKRECYKFVTVAGRAYMDKFENVTSYFLKDIISGKKKCKYHLLINQMVLVISCDNVHVCFLPYYDTITIEILLEQSANFP